MTKSKILLARFGTYLDRLMTRSEIAAKGEDALSIHVADMMRKFTKDGAYRGVWFHVPNEGKRTDYAGAKCKAMGMIPGVTDFIFMWDGGHGGIELKVKKNPLTDTQEDFKSWCDDSGVPWALCRSKEEVYATLLGWGALRVTQVTQ